jgi:hypothetical protein
VRKSVRTACACAVVVLLGCWLFSDALFSGRVLAGDDVVLFKPPFKPPPGQTKPANPYLFDSAWVFHPDMLVARSQLRDLRLPIWNPDQGGGQPLLASQQVAALFPLNWPADVFPFWQSLEWIALLKLLVAGVGTVLFLRSLALRLLPSLFGAVAFTFSTYLVDWLAHPHANVYILLPWLLLAGDRVVTRGRVRDASLLAVAVGLSLLGGHPESSLLVLLAAAGWWGFRIWESPRGSEETRPQVARTGWLLAAGVVGGVLVSAVTLVPFAEMLTQSQDASRSGGPGPRSMLESFLLPERWGRPDKFSLPGGASNYQERTAYFGALPLLFGVAGMVIRTRAVQVFFAALGLLALGLAIDIPVYSDLAARLPGLDVINRTRALSVCTFAGATLAALGLQALMDAERVERRRIALAALLAIAPPMLWLATRVDWGTPLGDALANLPTLDHRPSEAAVVEFATALRWAVLALAAAALMLMVAWRPRLATGAAVVAIAITGADLVTLDRGYLPAIPLAVADPPLPAAILEAQAWDGHQRVTGGSGLEPNLASRFGLRGARIHALPVLKRRNMLWFGLGGGGMLQRLDSTPRRLASLYAAKYVFVDAGQTLSDRNAHRVSPGLFENRAALPRAWVAYDWSLASTPEQSLAVLRAQRQQDDMRRPVIEGASPPASRGEPAPDPAPAQFTEDSDERIRLSVDAKRAGYLVLSDTYYPGWQATVDGRRAEIQPADVAFRAVAVPAGRHTVAFEYNPLSVRVGGALSLAGLVAIALGLLLTRRRTRTERR